MTREWREAVPCSRCGSPVSTEQPIKAWIRTHRELDSRQECLCVGDSDLWVQRYGVREWHKGIDRSVMYLMLVEVKTNSADINDPQRDLLMIINDLLRTVPWKEQRVNGRFVPGHDQNARIVHSHIAGQKVQVHCYGVHKLRLSGSTPDQSDRITWDTKQIDTEQLVKILRYDLSPDTLKPMEHRSHKKLISLPDQPTLMDIIDANGAA